MLNEQSVAVAGENETVSTTVRGIWRNFLSANPATDDDEFFDLGGNSVLLLGMLGAIQEQFNKEIKLEDLSSGVTINRIAHLLS